MISLGDRAAHKLARKAGLVRIAVLSDIHAMKACLVQALADARDEGFDVLLILGDLLTYGVSPLETLELINDAIVRDGAVLVMGNHDQFYLGMGGAACDYRAGLPGWLRESVEWTAAQLPAGAMDNFDWQNEWSTGPLLAAHANPYEFGDWTYLVDADQAGAAALILAQRGYRYGVFGHTHRTRAFEYGGVSIFTIGSLGQPRDDRERQPQWAMINLDDGGILVQPRNIAFDRVGHLAAIRATTLSRPTQERLCGFFA